MMPTDIVRTVQWNRDDANELLDREWLVTNALGGYASGTIAGVPTRRYHGLLIAALPVHGRTVMLNHLTEEIELPDGSRVHIGGEENATALRADVAHLSDFRLEMGLPVWRYAVGDTVIEKRVHMVYGQNTVHVGYRLIGGDGAITLRVAPAIAFRPHDEPLTLQSGRRYEFTTTQQGRYIFCDADFATLRVKLVGEKQRLTISWNDDVPLHYRVDASRGYAANQMTLRPGHFSFVLAPHAPVATLIASTEEWEAIDAHDPAQSLEAEQDRRRRLVAQTSPDEFAAELTLAADAFIVTPGWRVHDLARGRASGMRYRSVIAGYHWFTDWGRDTMIGLEGLVLATGRHNEARDILLMFGEHVRDGLIPNMFPEGREEGLYHTADATLWFFHAIDRYVTWTNDMSLVEELLPKLREIVAAHIAGTRFGIGVDARDGLLRQGAEGYQLTWMDAKVGDWVVTPRRGKAVEINALWYNALRTLRGWTGDAAAAAELEQHAQRARESFNARFWRDDGGYLYDVIDGEHGDDTACRPNQVFAIALKHPVLEEEKWTSVMRVVTDRLLTPYGLRSLSRDHPDYKSRYFGDLKARDAAYHQGTVWAWLIGPYIDAWRKLHPHDDAGARRLLEPLLCHLGDAGIGSISEVFDAEAPFTPRGCIAQAWSVAEVLRCWRVAANLSSDER
ncbi:MAG TPA: amylo-alpha-1,6-glucosidase [Rudaea sp.]|jgi:predicted glycogen debranching enzyme|nr:amylo-alpha-1,6-glucosidase [Rudaea sp.]